MMPKDIPLPFARAVVVALLAAAPFITASAQSPDITPPAGAAVIVIIPDSLAIAPRTVSELLRAYAPGASVQRSTGAIGASAWVSLRDASAILGGDPLVVVDGIRQVIARANLDTLDRREPSILDDMMIDDVARVEILPGPAAAASYGDDGQRGAIVITTRAPGEGRPRFSASVTTSSADADPGYARNLSRATSNGYACPYYLEAQGICTATVTTRYTPLLDRSPFRSAQQLRAHLGAIGGLGPLGYAASLGFERGSGTLQSDAADRTIASLRLRLPVTPAIRVSLASFATGRGISFPTQGGNSLLAWGVGGGPLDCSASTPCGTDSSSRGYRMPLDWLEGTRPHRRIGHLGTALAVDADPLSRLSLRTSVTADMFRDEEALRDSSPLVYMATVTQATAEERSWRVDAAEEARLTAAIAGAAATTTVAIRFDADRGRSESETRIVYLAGGYPGAYSSASTNAFLFRDRLSQSLDQRLAWGERAALGVGVTRTSTDFNTGRRPPVLVDPHADALYQLVGGGAPLGILESLRLRAAWAQASAQNLGALNRPAIDYGGTYGGYGYGASGPVRPRTPADRSTELEGGIDAALGVAASRLSITAFTRKERLDWIAPFFLANTADRKVTGGELAAEATPLDLPVARLHVRGQLAVSHDRVESGSGSRAQLSSGPGIALTVRDGESWGTWLTQPASWNDANGNGRIERSEVSYLDVRIGGRSRPASVAKLSGDLELLHSFTVTAIADHVGGFDVYDAAGAQQCWRGVCPALNDPNAPIDAQGRAVAVAAGRGAGYLVPGDATTLRELSLSWRSPRAATVLRATSFRVTLSAYDLARWSRSQGLRPETDAPAPGLRPNLWSIVQPVPRTVAVRVAVGY